MFYAPLDFVFVIRRVLRQVRPRVLVVAETEIWPNLFREVKRAGCGLIVVNARISDEAAPRYRKWRWFFHHALQWPDAILAQNVPMRERFVALGAPQEKITVGGNLKYDFQPGNPPAIVESFLDQLRPSAIWIAASTMPPDEDDIVIEAFEACSREIRFAADTRAPKAGAVRCGGEKIGGIRSGLGSAIGVEGGAGGFACRFCLAPRLHG